MYRSFSAFVLFALLASAVAVPGHIHDLFEAAKQKCAAEVGIDADLVKGPPPPPEEHPTGPLGDKLKCFGACLMKDHGLIKEDGSFDGDKAISYVPADIPARDVIVAALTSCSAKKGTDDCDTAHEVFTCLRENHVPMKMLHKHHHERRMV